MKKIPIIIAILFCIAIAHYMHGETVTSLQFTGKLTEITVIESESKLIKNKTDIFTSDGDNFIVWGDAKFSLGDALIIKNKKSGRNCITNIVQSQNIKTKTGGLLTAKTSSSCYDIDNI